MRCARLSFIAYIHDKTSDLPGYIYIYINIAPPSNVRREKQRRERSGYVRARFYAG